MKPVFNQLAEGTIIEEGDQFKAQDLQWYGVKKHLPTSIGLPVGPSVLFRRQVKFKKVSKSDQ